MPTGLGTATTGNNGGSSPGDSSGGDIGSSGAAEGGGTIIIEQGSASSSGYQYDIVSILGGNGNAYLAFNNSNISCNSSVAVFNRNNSFSAYKTSVGNFSNCCSFAAGKGFVAWDTSTAYTTVCVSSLAEYNYISYGSSSMYASISASVFPLKYGVYASHASSFIANEFETMTRNDDSLMPTPMHFRSGQNSYCANSSVALTSKTSVGLSGPVLSGKNVSFVWSEIWRDPVTGVGFSTGPSTSNPYNSTAPASYRYVPFAHSLDYGNIVNPTTGVFGTDNSVTDRDIITIYSQGRNCYTSVKPPAHMFKPEDLSGNTGTGFMTGTYTASALLSSLV